MGDFLEDQHRMFIQAFMWKKICSAEEVRSIHRKCHEQNHVPVSDLKAFVEKINNALYLINMTITKGTDEVTGEDYYVLTNATDNSISRLSGEYKQNELELFKKIITCIVESEDGKVPSITVLNLADEVSISKKDAEEIVTKFSKDGWLLTDGGSIFLSTRAIAELQIFLKAHFRDIITVCFVCKNVVFQGDACGQCDKKIHHHCKRNFFSQRAREICPTCQADWQ
ncbi:non-structural maintenance of chromosomes element 1 homolog [Uloborus diversus]|uniref:non-structural maintenance of chromosomes element 1 homolog n=1 Tax=Uloborus diversus TaxID=327109 RepID=UPI00240A8EB3|nr:non-structural maintenance of chromosomes element 1 homolog [Uloborus diversus]XP_054717695.1 non-structural maintenance of chromosomes element 1 homolog [Uloborus diversus]